MNQNLNTQAKDIKPFQILKVHLKSNLKSETQAQDQLVIKPANK